MKALQLLIVVALVAASGPAYADARERALELNSEGQELYAAGKYEEAAQKFIAAHVEFPSPDLKLAEALAWYKHGNCAAALTAADEFKRAKPDAPKVDQADMNYVRAECTVKKGVGLLEGDDIEGAEAEVVRARALNTDGRADESIAALERDIAAAREAATAELEPEPIEPAESEANEVTEVVVEEPATTKRTGSTRRIIGWTLVGAGAAAGIVAGATYFSQADKIDKDAGECVDCSETVHAINRASIVAAPVLGVVGLALVLWPDSEKPVAVGPGPGNVGASVTLRF